jgi:type IX secretion system PorP/SprF family membrane protein
MKYALIFIWFGCISVGLSQQLPQHSQYMLNKYRDNPAYGGLERSLSVFTSYRDQLSTFTGNPKTFYIGADMPFYIWNGAVGFTLFNQRAGVFTNTNLKLSYNYVMGTNVGFLSFGGRVGVDHMGVDGTGIITPEGSYEGVFNHNDPTLDINRFSGVGLSWELGTYFYGSSLEAGIVVSEFPTHPYRLGNATYNRNWSSSLFLQYKLNLTNGIKLAPSLQVKVDQAVLQTDLGAFARFNDNLLLGLNFRGYSPTSIDAFSVVLGTNIGKKYFVTYSYDFGLSQLRSFHQGSHELMLSYNLQKLIGIGLPPKIIYNPRNL